MSLSLSHSLNNSLPLFSFLCFSSGSWSLFPSFLSSFQSVFGLCLDPFPSSIPIYHLLRFLILFLIFIIHPFWKLHRSAFSCIFCLFSRVFPTSVSVLLFLSYRFSRTLHSFSPSLWSLSSRPRSLLLILFVSFKRCMFIYARISSHSIVVVVRCSFLFDPSWYFHIFAR